MSCGRLEYAPTGSNLSISREMLLCWSFLVFLLVDSVLADVCSHVFSQPGKLVASSRPPSPSTANKRCEYYIRAPPDSNIALNFTKLYGFTLKKHHRSSSTDRSAAANCLPRVDIVEVAHSGRERTMCTLCEVYNNSLAPQVFLSRTPLVRLIFTWIGGRRTFFHLTFDFNHLESPACGFTCSDTSCLPESSLVCNGVADCLDASDEVGCPSSKPQSGGSSNGPEESSASSSDDANNLIKVIIVTAIVVPLVVILCSVSHYCVMSRLWRDRHHRGNRGSGTEHRPLQPSHAEDQYVAPTCGVTPSERTTRDIMTQNLPPSISISEDGEEGYSNSQRMLRKKQQDYEYAKVGCVQPPPNRTVFQGESPPPYRSRSVGALSHSAAIARKTSQIKAKDMTMTPPTTMASASPAAAQLSNNNNHVISSNFNLLDGPPALHGSGEQTLCNCTRCSAAGERRHTVIRGSTTTSTPSTLTSTSMTTTSSCLAGDVAHRRGSCQGNMLHHNRAIDSGCEHYGVTCGFGPPPPYTDSQSGGDGGGGVQYNSSI